LARRCADRAVNSAIFVSSERVFAGDFTVSAQACGDGLSGSALNDACSTNTDVLILVIGTKLRHQPRTKPMNLLLRGLCLFAYVMASAKLAGLLPEGQFEHAPIVAGVLLGLHLLEVIFMFRHVRLYKGSLAVSIILTLLFGLLHWKPLADARARAEIRG